MRTLRPVVALALLAPLLTAAPAAADPLEFGPCPFDGAVPLLGREQHVLVLVEVLVVLDRVGERRVAIGLAILGRDVHERENIRIDDAQLGLGAELTPQQPGRLQVAIDIFGTARDETGDEHALERGHVQFRTDRRLDWNLVVARASHGHHDRREATDCPGESCGH